MTSGQQHTIGVAGEGDSCVCSSIACMLMKSNSILLCDEYMPEGSYGAAAVEAEKS